jgi:hypothetical protein
MKMNAFDRTSGDSAPVWLPPRDTHDGQHRSPVRRFDDGAEVPVDCDRVRDVRQATRTSTESNRVAAWGLAAVLLLSGYEWLLSGLDKLFSADFRSGLGGEIQEAMSGNPNHWYVRFLADVVVPHARICATFVECGEIAVAFGLFVGAAVWIGGDRIPRRWERRLHLVASGALLSSAVMTANYYLMSGNRFPWLNTGAPFDEGLDIDGLLTLVSLSLLAIHLLALRNWTVDRGTAITRQAREDTCAGGESAANRRRVRGAIVRQPV